MPLFSRLQSSRVEEQITEILETGRNLPIAPTGLNRSHYLDLIEHLVRVAAEWQDADGAIIDPVAGKELGQTSPRFVSSAAVLLRFQRIPELRPLVFRGMDWCCRRLASGQADSPDFWMREILTAWMALQDEPVPAGRRGEWERHIRSIDPEAIYRQVSRDGSKLNELHNWTVYAAAGESLRWLAGLGPQRGESAIVWGRKFFEKYMPAQLAHFSPDGLYRDPGDPLTYDMTTRLQFTTPRMFGFTSAIEPALEERLRRGALTQLLYVSPDGFAPFGGRSNQIHIQEAILAALGEAEARRYREQNPRLAGAFKRQARLGVRSIRRWLCEMEPHRHLKNGFPPETRHGCEGYAGYAVYTLFAASCLALAAWFADESIEESATPAEIGGYVLELAPAFHKIFAAGGGTQIEIDTAADPKYDATGLGRFHRAGIPPELGLHAPLPSTPNFQVPENLKPARPLAIGPAWLRGSEDWISLAELSKGLSSSLRVEETSAARVVFQIDWQHPDSQISVSERYELTQGCLGLSFRVFSPTQKIERIRLLIPLLETDGANHSNLTLNANSARVHYLNARYEVGFENGTTCSLGDSAANRNGIYRPLILEKEGNHLSVRLNLHADPAITTVQ